MADETQSLYDVLGVDRGASTDEIRAAFKRKAKELHPTTSPYRTPDKALEEYRDASQRLLEIMELVIAEWKSDPMSVQCFDLGIVEEAKTLDARRKELKPKLPTWMV